MKVILIKEVLGLGSPGETITVKDGYGRNYLVPKGLAIIATKKNIALVIAEQKRIAVQQAQEAQRLKVEADRLSGLTVRITARAGEGGKLYGSITNIDIAQALAIINHNIDRRRILLEAPIKRLGAYPVKIKLHPQVMVDIKVLVET